MFVGTRQGTGVIGRNALTAGAIDGEATATYIVPTTSVTSYTNTNVGIYVDPPTNGMAQFKGQTTSADQKKYLQVICLGVAPVYATWAQSLEELRQSYRSLTTVALVFAYRLPCRLAHLKNPVCRPNW